MYPTCCSFCSGGSRGRGPRAGLRVKAACVSSHFRCGFSKEDENTFSPVFTHRENKGPPTKNIPAGGWFGESVLSFPMFYGVYAFLMPGGLQTCRASASKGTVLREAGGPLRTQRSGPWRTNGPCFWKCARMIHTGRFENFGHGDQYFNFPMLPLCVRAHCGRY